MFTGLCMIGFPPSEEHGLLGKLCNNKSNKHVLRVYCVSDTRLRSLIFIFLIRSLKGNSSWKLLLSISNRLSENEAWRDRKWPRSLRMTKVGCFLCSFSWFIPSKVGSLSCSVSRGHWFHLILYELFYSTVFVTH